LKRTNPFTIVYQVDNPGMKEFQNLLLHYFPHDVVESTLRFS
jgi:hypothetical protein